jgi:hypothetical protein
MGVGDMKRPLAAASAIAVALAVPAAASAALPSVSSGHRPGPDALYAPPPSSVPQLENSAPWVADPILVSGTQAYRDGEWLYQDFLHDDHGAAGARDPEDPFGPDAHLFSPTAGTLTYPTDPVYANNAADLVELRIRPLANATAFRVTLNTLKDPERTAFTIALGTSAGPRPWPNGAGVSSPAELFLTVHGTTAELRDATTGLAKDGGADVTGVNTARRQIDVRVPHAAWNPGAAKVRVAIGVGLWNRDASAYLAPAGAAGANTPGGAAPSGARLFNVGPRFTEPFPEVRNAAGYTIGDAAAGAAAMAYWWREYAQASALRTGDASPFAAEVDFAKLAARTDDDSGVPKAGPMNRILASRHQFGQGVDVGRSCGGISQAGSRCEGRFVGQLQPYALYVPQKPMPKDGYGLTLLLHSLSANYNQYSASNNQSQFGERGPGTLVATPSGRGPDGFYAGIAEADTFEVWADVARLYRVDPGWVVVSGYSMGAYGTFRMLARWPDLFARGMSTVGVPGSASDQLPSLRNTPIMTWNAAGDELVPVSSSEAMVRDMTAAGLRFVHWLFPTADHLTLATNDEYGPAADFLGTHRVDRAPPHVTYVVDLGEDSAAAQARADHAYWVSGLRLRDENVSRRGTIDARSAAFGVGDPEVLPVAQSTGTLNGGAKGPMPYQQREQAWGPTPDLATTDKLFVRAQNLSAATFDARRARLSCAPKLYVGTDGPLDMTIGCTERPKRASRCSRTVAVKLPRVAARPNVDVSIKRGSRQLAHVKRARVLKVHLRRPTRRAFSLAVDTVAGGDGPALSLHVTRRFGACG